MIPVIIEKYQLLRILNNKLQAIFYCHFKDAFVVIIFMIPVIIKKYQNCQNAFNINL